MLSRVIALAFVLLLPRAAGAMFFEVEYLTDAKMPAVSGYGNIEPGDAVRLEVALSQMPRIEPAGIKLLALNSNGGSVQEAYRMAEVIDRVGGVMAVVPDAALCASACTLVYLAADYRIVTGEGALGFHSCRDASTGIANQLCNEEMADFAMQQGTFLNTVLQFTKNVPPNRMAYFDQELADCWELTRWPGSQPDGHGNCAEKAFEEAMERHFREQE
ncbi:MAG: hypothetical protein RIC87_12600 [Kiloniellales bacterium]